MQVSGATGTGEVGVRSGVTVGRRQRCGGSGPG